MRTPCSARATPSSTSGTSVMQTGQPGPMMTFRFLGQTERRPKRAIACSWLPQTCMTLATRPMSSVARCSARVSARARAGSRNFISASWGSLSRRMRGLELVAHVGGHQILWLGLAQDGVEEVQRLADLVLRDAVDGEPHVVEHVVAGLHRHVHDVEAHLPLHAEEVHGGDEPIDGQHLAGDTETHAATFLQGPRRPAARETRWNYAAGASHQTSGMVGTARGAGRAPSRNSSRMICASMMGSVRRTSEESPAPVSIRAGITPMSSTSLGQRPIMFSRMRASRRVGSCGL